MNSQGEQILNLDARIARLEEQAREYDLMALADSIARLEERLDRLSLQAKVIVHRELTAPDGEDRSQFMTMADIRDRFGGVTRATVYNWIKYSLFPLPVSSGIGGQPSLWAKEAVDIWEAKYGTMAKRRTLALIQRLKRLEAEKLAG